MCADFQAELQDALNLDVTTDKECIRPTNFCHSCRGVLYTQERANNQNKEYQRVRLAVFDWVEHEPECKVCQHIFEKRWQTSENTKTRTTTKKFP